MPYQISAACSVLHPDALGAALAEPYRLPAPVTATFLSPGVNDTYQVTAAGRPAFFRLYRAGWRTPSDIQWELDLLLHLHNQGVAVSLPIPRADGAQITEFDAPEGVRAGVLFAEAPGKVLTYTEEDAARYGALVARLHTAMDRFTPNTPRVPLDLEHLLDQPLRTIQPYAEDLGLWPYLEGLGAGLREQVLAAQPHLEWGPCHGDLHGHNVHQTPDGQMTLFDFDCGGPGFRAYDLAVYRWAVSRHAKSAAPWEAFLAAYQTHRNLGQADLDLVPVFVAIRTLWLLGLHAGQVLQRGTASVRMWVEGGTQALRAWEKGELA